MKRTMQYSVGGKRVTVGSDEVDQFLSASKERGYEPEEVSTFRVTPKDGEAKDVTVPVSQVGRFKEESAKRGYGVDDVRTMTMVDGTRRNFTKPELANYLRSKEYRESADYGGDPKQGSVAGAAVKGFGREAYNQLGGSAQSIRDTAAESNPIYKGYAYAQDLANSLTSGFLGGLAKIEQGAGYLYERAGDAIGSKGMAKAGRSWQEDAKAGQKKLSAALPNDMLDTSKVGVVNRALDVGKGVASVTGEFAPAMIPGVGQAYAASVISSGAVNRSVEVYDQAIANGMSPAKASALANGAGAVDAVQNLLLMGKFKGIWGGAEKKAAEAVKRSFVGKALGVAGETAKTGAIMGTGAAAQDVISQKAEGAKEVDWKRTADAGIDGFVEGGMFHLVNAGAHKLANPVSWAGEAKTAPSGYVRDALDTPEGRALLFSNNPEAAKEIYEARKSGKDVSRTMLKRAGIPEGVAPDAANRNAIGDALVEDYNAYRGWVTGSELKYDAARQKAVEERRSTEAQMAENEQAAAERGQKEASARGVEERAQRKAEMAEYEKQEAERIAAERESQEVPPMGAEPKITVSSPTEQAAAEAKPVARTEEWPEYAAWLKRNFRADTDKNWNRFVGENELDPALKVERGKDTKSEVESPVEKTADGKGKMVEKPVEKPVDEPITEEASKTPVETSEEEGVKPTEQTAPKVVEATEEAKTETPEEFRERVKDDPVLNRIDQAMKTAKTDAERNALTDQFKARVDELRGATESEEVSKTDAEASKTDIEATESSEAKPDGRGRMVKEKTESTIEEPKLLDAPVRIENMTVDEIYSLPDGTEIADYVYGRHGGNGSPGTKWGHPSWVYHTKNGKQILVSEVIGTDNEVSYDFAMPDGMRFVRNSIAEGLRYANDEYVPLNGKENIKSPFKRVSKESAAASQPKMAETVTPVATKSAETPSRDDYVREAIGKDPLLGKIVGDKKIPDAIADKIADAQMRLNAATSDYDVARAKEYENGNKGRGWSAERNEANERIGEIWHELAEAKKELIGALKDSEKSAEPVQRVADGKGEMKTVEPVETQYDRAVKAVESAEEKSKNARSFDELADINSRARSALGKITREQENELMERLDKAWKDNKGRVENVRSQGGYTPSKEIIEAKSRIEAMPTFSSREKEAKKKAQKDWLLSSVDDAIRSHGDMRTMNGKPFAESFVDEFESLLRRRNATYKLDKLDKLNEQIDIAKKTMAQGEMLTFDVPDDGTFKIRNNPEALSMFKRMVQKRLSPTNLKEGTLAKAEKPLAEDVKDAGIGKKETVDGNERTNALNVDVPRTPEAEVAERTSESNRKASQSEPNEAAMLTLDEAANGIDRIVEEEMASRGSDAAQGLPARTVSKGPGAGVKEGLFTKLRSRNSIVRTMKEQFPEFAIRGENTTKIGRNYSGHFEPWNLVIRSKDRASIDTIPHEIGHGIDMLTRKSGLPLPKDVGRELVTYGKQLYGNKKPNGGYMGEGFAEFVRGYITGEQATLAREAPNAYKWFTDVFAKKHPDYVRRIDKVAAEVTHYLQQDAVQRVRAMAEDEMSAWQKTKSTVKDLFKQEAWNDENATISKGMKASGLDANYRWQENWRKIEKLEGEGKRGTPEYDAEVKALNEKILDDPRIFAANTRGTAKSRAVQAISGGVTDVRGVNKLGNVMLDKNGKIRRNADGSIVRDSETESMQDILKGIPRQKRGDFSTYALAKCGLENYVKEGREFGVDRKTLEQAVKALETPEFEDALLRMTRFMRRQLSVGLDVGAIDESAYLAMTKRPYYVRIERRFADDEIGTGGAQSNPIKGIKGSVRNFHDIYTSTGMQMERLVRHFQQMELLRLVAKAVDKGEKMNMTQNGLNGKPFAIGANMPISVRNAREAVTFSSEKIRDDFMKRAAWYLEDAGLADPSTMTVFRNKAMSEAQAKAIEMYEAMYGQDGDALTFFRDAPSRGKNGDVSIYVDGKLKTVEIPNGDWSKLFTGFNESGGPLDGKWGKIVWEAATAPAKAVRLGATGLKSAFQTANFSRDTLDAAASSENRYIPYVSSIEGLVNEFRGSNGAKLFKQMGGEMANFSGSSGESQWRKGTKSSIEANPIYRLVADVDKNHPIRSAMGVLSEMVNETEDVLSVFEQASRVREMDAVMKKMGKMGVSEEAAAQIAFAQAKDISLDFGRHGYAMKRINQIIPFTNAAFRALEKTGRNFGLLDSLPTQFNDGKKFSKDAAKRAAKTAGKGLMLITSVNAAVAIAQMLNSSEEEKRAIFKKTKQEKWDYLDIAGVRVPQSYDFGRIFGAIPRAAVYEMFGDKGALREATEYTISEMLKFMNPVEAARNVAATAPYLSIEANEKWDGSPIVSPIIMEKYPYNKEMWADYSTSEVAKRLGDAFNKAPAHIDFIANHYTGGMWGRWLSPAADNSLMTLTGLSTFRPRPTARRDVNDFYETRSRLTSEFNAGKSNPEDAGKMKRAEKLQNELTPIFKEMRALNNSGLGTDERNRKRESLMNDVFKKIGEWERDTEHDRKTGIAKAASSLTESVELSDDVKSKNLAILKGIDRREAIKALVDYGREIETQRIKNKGGYFTGRVKRSRRWEDETIIRRVRLLNRVLDNDENRED